MKIAFCADLHIANHRKWGQPSRGHVAPVNTRAADILRVLSRARSKAEELGCTDLFVLGDVFDTSSPSPQLLAETQYALAGSREMAVHLLVGNHDQQSDVRGDHALVSMDHVRGVRVYDKPEIVYPQEGGGAVWMVPYRPGRADEYLQSVVSELGAQEEPGGKQVLALHLGLRDAETPPWLQAAHDSYAVAELPKLGTFDIVMAGNWHERKHYMDRTVWQVGALVPTGFDNPGMRGYGSLLVYDGMRVVDHELPGPRFVRALGLEGARKALAEIDRLDTGWTTYVSVRCRLDERQAVQELFELADHSYVELLTDKEAAEEAARSAATAAAYASTDGIQAAVRAYVDRMALPADVQREVVLHKALDYVAGAAA